MSPQDGKNTISKNTTRRRRYIPLLVAATILFLCMAQLEEFNVGWKKLTSNQNPTGITYIRSSTSGWNELENNQEQREDSKQVPSSNIPNSSTGWHHPVVEGNQQTAETTSNGGLAIINTTGLDPTETESNQKAEVTNDSVSNVSAGEEAPTPSNQQETESTKSDNSNTTNTTKGWKEWKSNLREVGSNNHTLNNTPAAGDLVSNPQEEVMTSSADTWNSTNTTTTGGEDIESNQQPEQSTKNLPMNFSVEGTTEPPINTTRLNSEEEHVLHQQICSKIPPGMSASKIWQMGLPIIEQGLQHPLDVDFAHRFWIHALLELLQPFLLKGSVRAQPSWQLVFPMMVKLAKHLQDPVSNPPLKIVVMGGSLSEGVQCGRPPLEAKALPFRSLQACSWPIRLNQVLNHVIQTMWNTASSPIDIKNIATGGTDTAAGTPVVQYWLNEHFQSSASEAGSTLDMIINGYAANDNIPDGGGKIQNINTTISNFHYFSRLRNVMNFAHEVANMNAPADSVNDTSCHAYPKNYKQGPSDPLLLFLNDYYGNLQLSLVGEGQRDEAVQWLTDMHDHTGYVSPPHSAILRWVWANVDDEIFSGVWTKMNKTKVDVHYGMSGHVVDTIFIAYYMLQLALDVCEQVALSPNTSATKTSVSEIISSAADAFSNGHEPDEYLSIDSSSESIQETSWNTFATIPHACETSPDFPLTVHSPCVFGFLTAAMGSHKTVESTRTYLKPYTREQRGWNVENDFRNDGFQNKMGLVANDTKATMVLATSDKDSVQQPIKFVTVYYLKSYGDEWEDSKVRFDVEVFGLPSDRGGPLSDAPLLHTENFTLEGFHDQKLSTNYVFKQELGVAVPVGGSMTLTMTLVSGKRFKIIAIMWCNK